MKHGFIKVAAVTFENTVANCKENAQNIISLVKQTNAAGVKLAVFPELSLCGSTCGDLIRSDVLLRSASDELCRIVTSTSDCDTIIILGFPMLVNNKIYNCAAVCHRGRLLGIVPKSQLSADEMRYFSAYSERPRQIQLGELTCCFGNMIFAPDNAELPFKIGVEIGTEAFASISPSCTLCAAGATVIANPFAQRETVGDDEYRHIMLSSLSARNVCGYVHAGAGYGESTTDGVFGGYCAIYENGKLIKSNNAFGGSGIVITDLDLGIISSERRRTVLSACNADIREAKFELGFSETPLERKYPLSPFVPEDRELLASRCEKILTMQATGLAQRITKAYAKKCIIGISGGLDSCLAILVAKRAMELLGKSSADIIGVTMPCFGTTERTRSNAELLCRSLGAELRCVNIGASVKQHFCDIGHDESLHNVVYENAQARERTQVIMDIANMEGGIVVGTGDLSELVLGWATYNGDHMSMYGVNSGVPKTLIRHVVAHCADLANASGNPDLVRALRDILDTPVSPELLPADKDGNIAQKTEDLVGPYEIHDFYIYYLLRFGFSPDKLYRIAKVAFEGKYSDEVLLKWLKNLVRRFFAQQFKRSCLPDGPKIGTVGISPRGDLVMPSDASCAEWLSTLED